MAEIIPNRVPCSKRVDPKPQPTPPEPKPVVVLCELSGVTYFKLRSDIPGDYTKNCGLLGDEIDKNFYFLRSMDIKTAYTRTEEDRKYLVLERVNCGREIVVDITDEDVYNYEFRVDDGYIYVKYPDGHEDPMRDGDGNPVRFLIEGYNVRVVTDASIIGDGTYGNPLALDLAYQTGTYEPADFFVDLTCPEATINEYENIGHGHGIVTKENQSRFGALYTYGQAKKINKALEGSGWRLPSKEDWAKLLNWAEEEDDKRNHDTDKSGNFGCVAGYRLKSTIFWEDDGKGADDFDFTIYPVGLCPEAYNTQEPTDYGFTGLYKTASYWTSSSSRTGEVYVRTFSYGHSDVYQGTESPARRLSIRLVRDTAGEFDVVEYAYILGNYVPVILTTDGKQQWTSLNIDFTNYEGYDARQVTVPSAWKDVDPDVSAITFYQLVEGEDGTYFYSGSCAGDGLTKYDIPSYVDPEMEPITEAEIPVNPVSGEDAEYIAVVYPIHLDMVTEAKFYYNAWDGNRWHKKLMREGESVVLIGKDAPNKCDTAATPYVTDDNLNHEWRVFVNELTGLDELIDVVDAIKRELRQEIKELIEAVSGLSEDVANLSGFVGDMYDEMQSGFTSAFTAIDDLQQKLDEEISARTEGDEALWDALNEEISARTEGDEELWDALAEEISARTEGDEELWDALAEEISARTQGDEELWSALTQEVADRIEADENLQEQIDELKNASIEPRDESIIVEKEGNITKIGVRLPADGHIKLDEDGLYFDGDFGLI